MRIGGLLLVENGQKIMDRARAIVAHVEGVPTTDIRVDAGHLVPAGTNRAYSLFEVARLAAGDDIPDPLRGPLAATASFTGRLPANPTGAAICEVEVDPETGRVTVVRYTSIDDAGQPINPLILHGQVHGGIAQGVGQALSEGVVTDQSGQVLTGSFMDYAMPHADLLPDLTVELVEDPTTANPLRIKGGGESGITPALATTINALCDALAEVGVEHIDMPATPCRVWNAIHAQKQGNAA
jgi:carbon-monoxide dehydrogenase large subunit